MSAALIAVVVIESCIIALYIGWRVYSTYQERGGSYQQAGGRPMGPPPGSYRSGPPQAQPQPQSRPTYPQQLPMRPQQVPYNQSRGMQPAPSPLYYANGA